MRNLCRVKFLVLVIAFCTLSTTRLQASCENSILQTQYLKLNLKREGVLIPAHSFPGYNDVFNGDVLGDLMVVRVAREGWVKQFSGKNLRGWDIVPDPAVKNGMYVSDLALVRKTGEHSVEFVGMVAATQVGLGDHIARLQSKVVPDYKAALKETILRDLQHLKNDRSAAIPKGLVLEDPRFMVMSNSDVYLFVTALARDAHDTAGIPQNQYRMAALKLRIDRNNRARPIQVEQFIPFGPLANKDTNVFEIDLNNQTKTEIVNIYRSLGKPVPNLQNHVRGVMLITRKDGFTQGIPFTSFEEAMRFSESDYNRIFESQLYRTYLKPDRSIYRSVGNNDQLLPLAPYDARYKDLLAYFFHFTSAQEFNPQNPGAPTLVYSTGVALMNTQGDLVGVAPLPIHSPKTPWEITGSVNHVVFNSGNQIVKGEDGKWHVDMYYGAADSHFAVSRLSLDEIVELVMTTNRMPSYDPRVGHTLSLDPTNFPIP